MLQFSSGLRVRHFCLFRPRYAGGLQGGTRSRVQAFVMFVIKTKLKPSSAEFRAAADRMRAQVEELNSRLAVVRQGGDAAASTRHQGRGKLLPRERIAALLDPDTAFLELSALAAWEVYEEPVPAAGIISGVRRD